MSVPTEEELEAFEIDLIVSALDYQLYEDPLDLIQQQRDVEMDMGSEEEEEELLVPTNAMEQELIKWEEEEVNAIHLPPIVKETRVVQECVDGWEEKEDEEQQQEDDEHGIKCHYIGCRVVMTREPLVCPDIDLRTVLPQHYVNPDADSIMRTTEEFCSYACMVAWAHYEIGDPIADPLSALIDKIAGYHVTPAPEPLAMLGFKFGGMMTHDEVKRLRFIFEMYFNLLYISGHAN